MNSTEKTQSIIKKEYEENYQKQEELMKKKKILETTSFQNRIATSLKIAIIPWGLTMLSIPTIALSGMIPINIIQPLAIGVPTIIGVIGEHFLHQKENQKLQKLFNIKTHQEQLEAKVRCKIELEKINCRNQALEKVYEHLESKQGIIQELESKYDMVEKKEELPTIQEINTDIQKLEKELKEKEEQLDRTVTKNVLKEIFWKEKEKFQKTNSLYKDSIIVMLICYIIYHLPLLFINHFNSIAIGTLPTFLPSVIGAITYITYKIKDRSDYNVIFEKVNKELEEESIPKLQRKKLGRHQALEIMMDMELVDVLESIYTRRLELETKKRIVEKQQPKKTIVYQYVPTETKRQEEYPLASALIKKRVKQ